LFSSEWPEWAILDGAVDTHRKERTAPARFTLTYAHVKKKKKGGEKIYITEQNFHCENFQNNKRRKGKNTKKKKKEKKHFFFNFLFFSFKVFVCPSCIRCPAQQQQQHTADGGTTKRERGVPKWFYDSLFSHTVEGGSRFSL
jgi:hypothetical protein